MLWFLGTFITLWAASLLVRGFLHRPRAAGAGHRERGPRSVKWRAVWTGMAVLPAGIGVCVAGDQVHHWMYGDDAPGASGLTAAHAMAVGTAAFGLVVAARGWWGDRSRGQKRCPKCWYEMGSLAGRMTCPECGHEAKGAADLLRTRRRWGLIAAGAAILVAGMGVPRFEAVRAGGIKGAVPTTLMIAAVWVLPDSWIDDPKRDDPFTLAGRLIGDRGWAWQRAWLESRVEAEVKAPTSIARLERALTLRGGGGGVPEAVAYAGSRLGSKDLEERLAAGALFSWGGPLDVDVDAPDAALRDALARRADEIAKGLENDDLDSVFLSAQLLGAAGVHTDRIVDAVLRASPRMTGRNWLYAATRLLLRWGGARPEVVRDLLAKSRLESRVAGQFWNGVAQEAQRGEIPRDLLDRADEELLSSRVSDVIWPTARLRLSGKQRSPAMESAIAVLAELPGRRRRPSLMALGAADRPGDRNRRSIVQREALRSGDPSVLVVALVGVTDQCLRGEPGAVCVLPDLLVLKDHPDSNVRSEAESALASYRAMFGRDPQ